MPKRFQPNVKNWVYRYLVLRDGEKCLICGAKPKKGKLLDIDHADNDTTNNEPSNLHLLCHKCNCSLRSKSSKNHVRFVAKHSAKNERERERERGNSQTSIVKELIDYRKGSPEMQANACFEVQFREWILTQVKDWGSYPKTDAMATGAEYVGCSPLTIGRYISKLVSDVGPLELATNGMNIQVLQLKAYYQE